MTGNPGDPRQRRPERLQRTEDMGFAAPERGKPIIGQCRLQIADIVVAQCQIGGEVARVRQVVHAAWFAGPAFQRVAGLLFHGCAQMLDAIQNFMGVETIHGEGLEVRCVRARMT